MPSPETSTPWQAVALASGTCAAFNGVFAKLCVSPLCMIPLTLPRTTADATATLVSSLSRAASLDQYEQVLEYALRAVLVPSSPTSCDLHSNQNLMRR
jgi:hypothetical protein